MGTPSPPSNQAGLSPPPSPLGYVLHPMQRMNQRPASENRTSASDSRSEAAATSRGGCGDHFGLFGASVRGQAAELEASAG